MCIRDSSSIIATARKLFLPDWQNTFLTNRDKNATTFDHVLNLATPDNIPGAAHVALQEAHTAMMAARTASVPPGQAPPSSKNKNLSNLQTDMVAHAHQAEQQYLPPEQRTGQSPADIQTESQASTYLQDVARRLRGCLLYTSRCV